MNETDSAGMIWSLVFLAVLVGLYGYIIRVGIHRKPVFGMTRHTLRYWRHRLVHVIR
ncbi:hypothetical protein QO239_01915 [Cupriavidus taiwanensis]|uniref:Uncharacterized protein n=1 Tax=Cupriavidus taiwanensis TaxID=164546 RepID=A0A375BJF8_9BURK|nr:hypothetical protein [Cupriavidus taiwanensis]MDK3021361.1 hypothetical protein [Cupriavidus taiwanensis]NSX15951.1 hypothetical protein [Cupriavidus taiwanensis]SOY46465.1 conserved hypothetical protein [Cupriavidus taiwanensis]